jgi:hypothetical protein
VKFVARLFGRLISHSSALSTAEALVRADPHLPDAQALFLGKFVKSQSVAKIAASDVTVRNWVSALGDELQNVVKELEKKNLLVRPSLASRLEGDFTLVELKNLCRQRFLKTMGKKADMASRLADFGGDDLEALAPLEDRYICSTSGREAVEAYKLRKKSQKYEAQSKSADLLDAHDFERAARLVCRYEFQQVFPRGIGVDWESGTVGLAAVKEIYSVEKYFLRNVSADNLENIRLLAALDELWGEDVDLIPNRDIEVPGCRFNLGIAARQLRLHYSDSPGSLAFRSGEAPIVMEYLAAHGDCSACMARNGKRYPLNGVPELPSEDCTCEFGCRCTFAAIMNDGVVD